MKSSVMKSNVITLSVWLALGLVSCSHGQKAGEVQGRKLWLNDGVVKVGTYIQNNPELNAYAVATFAGGCFWCTEASFERIAGVIDVISGYSGGIKEFPTYSEVSNQMTKHAEAIQIFYDSAVITYQELLEIFFVAHDPTQLNRQGPDVGPQYRSAIFYTSENEKQLAESYISKLNESGKFEKPIVTELSRYKEFWVAEGYHQNYYELHPDQPYVYNVSRPKVEKVMRTFQDKLKKMYR